LDESNPLDACCEGLPSSRAGMGNSRAGMEGRVVLDLIPITVLEWSTVNL